MDMQKTIDKILNNTKISQYQYTHGLCLVFALLLSEECAGHILFLPEYYHFVLQHGNKIYDATGNVSKKYADAKKILLENVPEKILKQYRKEPEVVRLFGGG